MSHNTCYLPTHPSAVNACRVARSAREVAALVYTSPSHLLWQLLIVLSTCSSKTYDASTTACTSSCASSRSFDSCSPFCHFRPTSLASLFASSETCFRSPNKSDWTRGPSMFFVACGLFFSHRRGRVENCSFFQMIYSFPSDSSSAVLSSPGSMIITFLSSANVALPVLNSCTTPQDFRPSLRSPSQGSFRHPTWRPSCIYLMHRTNPAILLLLAQQPVVPQRRPTLPSRTMVYTTTCRHPAHQFMFLCTLSYISMFT